MDQNTQEKIQTLNEIINNAGHKKIVFFGGAGVSTESGIPDFRSPDGLYNQQYKFPPEMIISRSFFDQNPQEFYRFYFDRMIPSKDIKPNDCHLQLAELERIGKLNAVVTQNIDGLHQAAGSKIVHELHGSILRNYCMTCHKEFDLDAIIDAHQNSEDGVPRCNEDGCKGIIKPDVVLYEEPLDNRVMRDAINAITSADVMIVAGTSLAVYPAAGLIDYFSGCDLIIINRDPTPRDKISNLCINASVGEVFAQLKFN